VWLERDDWGDEESELEIGVRFCWLAGRVVCGAVGWFEGWGCIYPWFPTFFKERFVGLWRKISHTYVSKSASSLKKKKKN
jgi:hypothetical protein